MSATEVPSSHPLLLTYTLFPSVWPTEKIERQDVPWSELVERIKNAPTYLDKKHCHLISLAEYGDTFDDEHKCLRYAENVRRCWGIELDYDLGLMPLATAAQRLREANLLAVLYTSPSHTPEKPRWRALLPLGDPALPEKRAEYVGRANRVLGGIASRESFTLSQSFYIGRVKGATYEVAETTGRTIDVAAELEPLYYVGHPGGNGHDRDPTTDADLRAAFQRGENRYIAMRTLSSRWAARGLSADDIETNLLELLGTGSHNADGIDLRTRVRPLAVSAVRKYGESRKPQLTPAPTPAQDEPPPELERHPGVELNFPALHGKEVPRRSWAIPDWVPFSGCTLLAGGGGIGKSLVVQAMASCVSIGREYLEMPPRELVSLCWMGEDDHDELWRRQDAIARLLPEPLAKFDKKLILKSYDGKDMELAAFGTYQERQRLLLGPMFEELRQQIGDYKADFIVIDNIARVFGGNENDRHQVTTFIAALTGLTQLRGSALVLVGHPAKQKDSEYSGSTAWEGSVRARLYLSRKPPEANKDDEDDDVDDGEGVRYLSRRKSNYSERDIRRLEYLHGVMVPDPPAERRGRAKPTPEFAQEVIVRAVRLLTERGEATSDRPGPGYLLKIMREWNLCEGVAIGDLKRALIQLRKDNRLVRGPVGKYDNRSTKYGLVLAEDAQN